MRNSITKNLSREKCSFPFHWIFAKKLVFSGFLTLEGILAAELSDLAAIEGISSEEAQSIWSSAEIAYTAEHGEIEE